MHQAERRRRGENAGVLGDGSLAAGRAEPPSWIRGPARGTAVGDMDGYRGWHAARQVLIPASAHGHGQHHAPGLPLRSPCERSARVPPRPARAGDFARSASTSARLPPAQEPLRDESPADTSNRPGTRPPTLARHLPSGRFAHRFRAVLPEDGG